MERSMAREIRRLCDYTVRGETDDELWEKAQAHMRALHPELVGKVRREDILAQAEVL